MAKSTKKNTPNQKPVKVQFHRWLLPGLLTVTFYLIAALIFALFRKEESGLTPESSFVITTLTIFMYITFAWWLLESARWIIIYIDQRSARKKPIKKRK